MSDPRHNYVRGTTSDCAVCGLPESSSVHASPGSSGGEQLTPASSPVPTGGLSEEERLRPWVALSRIGAHGALSDNEWHMIEIAREAIMSMPDELRAGLREALARLASGTKDPAASLDADQP